MENYDTKQKKALLHLQNACDETSLTLKILIWVAFYCLILLKEFIVWIDLGYDICVLCVYTIHV